MALPYDLYFTGSPGNPRQCIIMGEDFEPVFFRFETPAVPMTQTRTTVYLNYESVAYFDWTTNLYLGAATVGQRPSFPMSMMVMPGSLPSARAFLFQEARFEWRRTLDATNAAHSYELYTAQNVRLARFRLCNIATPIGPSHGVLQYTHIARGLLLEALLALCVNRWVDMHYPA